MDFNALNIDAKRVVSMLKERGIKTTSLTKSSLRTSFKKLVLKSSQGKLMDPPLSQ